METGATGKLEGQETLLAVSCFSGAPMHAMCSPPPVLALDPLPLGLFRVHHSLHVHLRLLVVVVLLMLSCCVGHGGLVLRHSGQLLSSSCCICPHHLLLLGSMGRGCQRSHRLCVCPLGPSCKRGHKERSGSAVERCARAGRPRSWDTCCCWVWLPWLDQGPCMEAPWTHWTPCCNLKPPPGWFRGDRCH